MATHCDNGAVFEFSFDDDLDYLLVIKFDTAVLVLSAPSPIALLALALRRKEAIQALVGMSDSANVFKQLRRRA